MSTLSSPTCTFTTPSHERDSAREGSSPLTYLTLVLRYTCPMEAPMRIDLTGARKVEIGRALASAIDRRSDAGSPCVEVRVPDPHMSTRHAGLRRERRRWVIADHGSKNGTLLNSRKITRSALRDGDRLVIGSSLFLFRTTRAASAGLDRARAAGLTSPEGPEDPVDATGESAASRPGAAGAASAKAAGATNAGAANAASRARAAGPSPASHARAAGPSPADCLPHEIDRTALTTLSPFHATELLRLADVAPSQVSLLIRGDTGTGKEVAARAVHALSRRRGPFVAVNCGALPENLIESELFGARKGAFSGASEEREGLVRSAHRGTLFLDEIAELSASSQVALLRVLQERQVVPVGGTRPVNVDVRFIAATHQDLEARIADGRFREDLYARVTGFEITLPPLRRRREDLGLLVAAILAETAPRRAECVRLSRRAARALLEYSWPRNIRELSNALQSALLVAKSGLIDLEHLPAPVQATIRTEPRSLDMRQPDALRAMLMDLLGRHEGNVAAVARALGKKRQQIHRWNRQLGIDPDEYRRSP